MIKKIIEIEKLNLYYDSLNLGKKKILKNINFYLNDNEFLCIIGKTGCGKTSLAKYIMGLLPESANFYSKKCIINGKNCVNKENIRGNTVNLVLQDSTSLLNPTLKIKNQFKLMIYDVYRNISKNDFYRMMKYLLLEVNLKEYESILNKYPMELSSGMNQRISIALSLIKNPKILILDEPTSSIDEYNINKLISLLKKIKSKRNMSIIFITHDIDLGEKIADRIIIMQDGLIIENVLRNNNKFNYKKKYSISLKESSFLKNKKEKKVNNKNKILEIKKLKKSFKNKLVLNDVNFYLCENETLGIVGPSGCGKSTLCKIIMGIYKYDSGLVKFYMNLEKDLIYQDAKIALNPYLTIYYILNEKNIINKKEKFDIQYINKYLVEFGLPKDIIYKFPYELSGGQRQLILIIRALLYNSKLLILDEPTSSLDVYTQKKVLDFLNIVKKKYKLSYIFISHDKKVINYVCDRCIFLK